MSWCSEILQAEFYDKTKFMFKFCRATIDHILRKLSFKKVICSVNFADNKMTSYRFIPLQALKIWWGDGWVLWFCVPHIVHVRRLRICFHYSNIISWNQNIIYFNVFLASSWLYSKFHLNKLKTGEIKFKITENIL